ncbi:MAG: hypothetical protein FJ387_14295 [Verrucomicrobia bacterium]|nr:hypothetical protein [Verrucomicrobiota bacterium]
MKTITIVTNRHTSLRAAALQRIAQTQPFLEGSLCSVKRPGCTQPGWHLTFKQKGRTRTVYVPMDLVPEVKTWTRNYKRLKKLIREVSRHSLALVRGHVANQRAAKRAQALTRP